MNTANLFVPFYTPASLDRFAELEYALKKNLEHEWLLRIILMIDDDTFLDIPPPGAKILIRRLGRRPTYADWLYFSAELGDQASLSICANADIELAGDFCLKACQEMISDKTILCITRHDLSEGGSYQLRSSPHWTQDTWVMTPSGVEAAAQSLRKQLDIPFGTPRCDNKVPYVFWLRNWKIVNPCERVLTFHHQKSAHRDYSKKDPSILGGVAYVHPSPYCGILSPVDVDIYSLTSQNPGRISHNKFLAKRDPGGESKPASLSLVRLNTPQPKKCALQERSGFLFTPRMMTDWTIIHRFTERFVVGQKSDRIAFIDINWPTATMYRDPGIDSFSAEEMLEAFLWGFCFPVTEFLPDQFSASKLFSDQRNFWQYPCRTEQDAYERHARMTSPFLHDGVAHTYIGLPWATWIDKKEFPLQLIKAFADRFRAVSSVLADRGIKLSVHTVCQHIHWKRYIDSFVQAGITDLWISHKEKGWDTESGLQLHAWPLYAVNALDPARREGLEVIPIEKKTIFASFKGAYMKHYLSDIRLKLQELAHLDGYQIEVSDLWHFNKVVYNYQIGGQENDKESIERQEMIAYNQLLSQSLFSLCPSGAGPNTLRLWESLAVGSIPVLLSDRYEFPRLPGLGSCDGKWSEAVIIHPEVNFDQLDQRLRNLPSSRLLSYQREGFLIYQATSALRCFN